MLDATAPFFIVGVPRSGTTLLAVLLDNHPEIYVGKTTSSHVLLDLHRRVMESYGLSDDARNCSLADRMRQALPPQDRVWELRPAGADPSAHAVPSLLAQARAETVHRQGKAIWGDKSPFMLNHIPQLCQFMPGVRFIHVIRDGRAVAQSRQRRRGFHPRLAIHEWKRMILLGRIDGETLGPERYCELRYEALVTNPRQELRRLCEWLGVPFDEAMLNLREADGGAQADAYVGKEIDASKINAWQRHFTARQVAGLERVAGDLLQALDYSLQGWPAAGPFQALAPLEVIWYHQRLAFQDLLQTKRTSMIERRMVEVSSPLRTRVRRFVSEAADLYLSQRLIELFRNRKVMLE